MVVRGKNIEPLVADEQYYVGSLGPIKYLQWLMSRHVVLALVLTGLGVILLSGLAYLALRALANRRLQGEPERAVDNSKPEA